MITPFFVISYIFEAMIMKVAVEQMLVLDDHFGNIDEDGTNEITNRTIFE